MPPTINAGRVRDVCPNCRHFAPVRYTGIVRILHSAGWASRPFRPRGQHDERESFRDMSTQRRKYSYGIMTRHAFTLVELLVVVAIIGILIALLLPAVQQAREAGRRISCSNNLKQLAIATHTYTETYGNLPPSGIVESKSLIDISSGKEYPVFDQRSGKMFSWAVVLLPFLEEGNLYDQFDLSVSVLEQPNEPQEAFVPTYLCASDSALGLYYEDEEFTAGKRFAKGNYAAYVSPFHSDLQLIHPAALIATGQKLSKVVDGTSKSVAFSEVRTRDELQDERGVWALPWNAASLLSLDMHHDRKAAGGSLAGWTGLALYAYQAQLPNTLGPNADILVRCPGGNGALGEAQVEGMPCHKSIWPLGLAGYVSAAPRSNHVGGVNVAYLDGHVAFVSNGVDPFTMAYLVDIRDEEVIGDVDP